MEYDLRLHIHIPPLPAASSPTWDLRFPATPISVSSCNGRPPSQQPRVPSLCPPGGQEIGSPSRGLGALGVQNPAAAERWVLRRVSRTGSSQAILACPSSLLCTGCHWELRMSLHPLSFSPNWLKPNELKVIKGSWQTDPNANSAIMEVSFL